MKKSSVTAARRRIEYREVGLPQELDCLQAFDRKVFGAFPDDLFRRKDWYNYSSHWMIVDKKIVGCSALQANVDYNEKRRPGCLWIASTGILPGKQNKGLGTTLTRWQLRFARNHGFSTIVTNTRESNLRMRKIYTKLGFKTRAKVDYYTRPKEPAVVMERCFFV